MVEARRIIYGSDIDAGSAPVTAHTGNDMRRRLVLLTVDLGDGRTEGFRSPRTTHVNSPSN